MLDKQPLVKRLNYSKTNQKVSGSKMSHKKPHKTEMTFLNIMVW